ncbi:sel1 repeat family protein [Jiella pacifica]|uniref:Sel1 repeat-containing protein n=1 Tax=Jiella pacifica TaxID=2696469 RepID=A0A6N9T0E8_9HYPH|nr:sel1 repeat family protein [Jiella pacifica]NDW04833.1 hypothetical protein [Jiella pacifica]
MTQRRERAGQDASAPVPVAPASRPMPARRIISPRGARFVGLFMLSAFAFPPGAVPALPRSASVEATAGGVHVALLGAGPGCLHKAGNGILVTIGDHRIVVSPEGIRFDGAETRLAGLRNVVVDASGWGLNVAADGRTVVAIDQLSALEEAAARGNTFAMNDLAVRLATGDGLVRDLDRAESLYRRAAEAGLALAASNLAALRRTGVGQPGVASPGSMPPSSPIDSDGQ